jgi:2-methylcitrate dehydratase PrpD
VIENMRKVKCTTTNETLPDMPFAPEDKLSIVLKSGETITHPPVARPKGSWQNPLNDDELRDKFIDCAKIGLGQQGADAAFRHMNGIERLASLRDLPLVARVLSAQPRN